MYFSARTEGRISYGHLGRTSLLLITLLSAYCCPHPNKLKLPGSIPDFYVFYVSSCILGFVYTTTENKRLICRRETARRFILTGNVLLQKSYTKSWQNVTLEQHTPELSLGLAL